MEQTNTLSLPIDSYCYATTLKCNHGLQLIKSEKAYQLIFDSLTILSKKFKVKILAYTILPDRVQLITSGVSSKKLPSFYESFKNITRNELVRLLDLEGEKDLVKQLRLSGHYDKYKVWETLFSEQAIKDLEALEETVQAFHKLPVLKKFVEAPMDYNYSSAPFYEKKKTYGIKVSDFREIFDSIGGES